MTVLAALMVAVLPACSREKKEKDEIYGKTTKAELPIEAKYQADGPEAVSMTEFPSENAAAIKIVVAYPSSLEAKGEKLPLVVLGNGSNTTADTFRPLMKHLASWGFVVIDNMDQQTATGASMVATLKEFLALSETEGNIFNGKIDHDNIAVAGYSQGATSSMMVATESEVSSLLKTIYVCSLPQPEIGKNFQWGEYDMGKVHIPILMFLGTGWADANVICPLELFAQNFENLPDETPAVRARRIGVDHDGMAGEGDPYMTAWFRYWLKGDDEALGAFKGSEAEILLNAQRWQDVKVQSL